MKARMKKEHLPGTVEDIYVLYLQECFIYREEYDFNELMKKNREHSVQQVFTFELFSSLFFYISHASLLTPRWRPTVFRNFQMSPLG